MATSDSPASARRRLRLQLRRSRDAAGYTQGDVAAALHWSLSKVQRIESGDVTISVTDVDALLRLLGADDSDLRERMLADARLARKRGWWDQPRYRGHLSTASLQVLQFEESASAIRAFQPAFFPGLLQHEQYARAIFDLAFADMPDETRDVRLEVRLRRRDAVWGRSNPPRYYLVLDELMLQRVVGDAAVAEQQFRTIVEFARRPGVVIRLLPKEQAQYLLLGGFTVFDFADEENAALYREVGVSDEIVLDPAGVEQYRLRFEQMWQLALSSAATISALEAQHANLRALLSRRS